MLRSMFMLSARTPACRTTGIRGLRNLSTTSRLPNQSLNGFLKVKGPAMKEYFDSIAGTSPEHEEKAVSVKTTRTIVQGRSGIRKITIREHDILVDSPPAWCGYNIGPAAPEVALGALGACLAHMYLALAGMQNLSMESLEIETKANLDLRKGGKGFEDQSAGLDNIEYTVYIESPESDEVLKKLHAEVEQVCPILNLMKNPQTISSKIYNGEREVV